MHRVITWLSPIWVTRVLFFVPGTARAVWFQSNSPLTWSQIFQVRSSIQTFSVLSSWNVCVSFLIAFCTLSFYCGRWTRKDSELQGASFRHGWRTRRAQNVVARPGCTRPCHGKGLWGLLPEEPWPYLYTWSLLQEVIWEGWVLGACNWWGNKFIYLIGSFRLTSLPFFAVLFQMIWVQNSITPFLWLDRQQKLLIESDISLSSIYFMIVLGDNDNMFLR